MPYPRHNPPDWKGLIEWPVRLFNEGQYALCIADCRTLLLYSTMPLWWRIRCQLLLAASLEDWDEAEVRETLSLGRDSIESIRP
jgi:hypothetical protein